jgi:glutamine amidotransferase PdxT
VCEDFRNGMGAQRHSYRFNIETENSESCKKKKVLVRIKRITEKTEWEGVRKENK